MAIIQSERGGGEIGGFPLAVKKGEGARCVHYYWRSSLSGTVQKNLNGRSQHFKQPQFAALRSGLGFRYEWSEDVNLFSTSSFFVYILLLGELLGHQIALQPHSQSVITARNLFSIQIYPPYLSLFLFMSTVKKITNNSVLSDLTD